MNKELKDSFKGWGIYWRYIMSHKEELSVLSMLGVFSAIANGSVPYVSGKFFDAILKPNLVVGISGASVSLWVVLLILWFLLQVVAIATDWVSSKKEDKLAGRLFIEYRSDAFQKLLLLPLSFHKDKKQGEFKDSMGRAANSLYNITSHIIVPLAPKILSIVVGLGFAFWMNIYLALVLVLGIFSYIFVLVRTVPQAIPLQRLVQEKWGDAWQKGSEAVSNIAAVKVFGAELLEGKKITLAHKVADKFGLKLEYIWSNINFFSRVIVVTTQLVIFVLSVFFINAEIISLGELLAFNGYAMIAFGPFVSLGQNWQSLQNGLVALERTERLMNEKEEDYTPKGGVDSFDFRGGIVFKNVSFMYKKDEQVLAGVSFEVAPGQVVALVGESGAGKSTLIDLISGYIFPKRGTILVDGHSTKNINLNFLRKHIAIVPQEVVLFHDTVKKNIAYGSLKATEDDIASAAQIAHADLFIEKFNKKYETTVGARGVKLSVGQKQRIAIARAVLRNPKILILDEPTSALDSETEKYVTEALDKVMAGRTTFVIAHRLSTVRKADKILVLEKGKIVEQGTHDQLMAIENGNYRRRYELHVGLV
jgi:ABC-type multidrug transport system fused ATPase/permease subunit